MGTNVQVGSKKFFDVPGVQLPIIGGGTASFFDVSGVTAQAADVVSGKTIVGPDGQPISGTRVYNPFGDDAELIATYDMGSTALADTLYNGWTPSTTAKAIKATSNLGTIAQADLETYEYYTYAVFESNTSYNAGTTVKSGVERQINIVVQYMYRKPNNLTKMLARNYGYNYCTTLNTAPFMKYRNGSGGLTMSWTGSYGIYAAATGHTFSDASASNPTITIKAPTYNARCSATYFSTDMAAAVNKSGSTIKCKVYVYRVKKASSIMYRIYKDIVDLYNV